jgi:hypothetical protein
MVNNFLDNLEKGQNSSQKGYGKGQKIGKADVYKDLNRSFAFDASHNSSIHAPGGHHLMNKNLNQSIDYSSGASTSLGMYTVGPGVMNPKGG